jgi:hypothetical protein
MISQLGYENSLLFNLIDEAVFFVYMPEPITS